MTRQLTMEQRWRQQDGEGEAGDDDRLTGGQRLPRGRHDQPGVCPPHPRSTGARGPVPSPRPGRTILVGEQTELACAIDRFGPGGSLQLAINGHDLALYRVASDVQLVTDLAQ